MIDKEINSGNKIKHDEKVYNILKNIKKEYRKNNSYLTKEQYNRLILLGIKL